MNKSVCVVFGGPSAEFEVSVDSARNIIRALDKSKYQVSFVVISKEGQWFWSDELEKLMNAPRNLNPEDFGEGCCISFGNNNVSVWGHKTKAELVNVDIFFPIVHGKLGEDGALQGFFQTAGTCFVGADILGSAVGMDKGVMKRLLKESGINVGRFIVKTSTDKSKIDYKEVEEQLKTPFYVKPCNMGSSVGITKVTNEQEFQGAIDNAFKYDNKIILEENIVGREIEVSVLGLEKVRVSLPGEVRPKEGFYSYRAKYLDSNGAELQIPAKLDGQTTQKIQALAKDVFSALCCQSMARIDFFLTENGEVFVNEINTHPGFTDISMYPKLWEVSGLSYQKLIDELISLAEKAKAQRDSLSNTYLDLN